MTKLRALGILVALLVLLVIFMLIAPVALAQRSYASLPATSPAPAAGKPAAGLSSLPPGAHGPISATLGKDDSRYWVHRNAKGFGGENPQHALVAEFTRQGAEVRSHNLRWALETRAYGYGDALHPVKAAMPQASANCVEYQRDGMTEWYENGPLGLEQGFTLDRQPGKANAQPLTVELALRGDLIAALDQSALGKKSKALELRGKDGKAVLRYTGLTARDAAGRELRSWLELRGERLLLRVEDSGARYPVVVDPWVQQWEMTASDGAASELFGYSVAVSGSTTVVGAPRHPTSGSGIHAGPGAAYVFVQNGTTWSQQAELAASDGAADDWFGASVAISGSTAVAGAPYHTVGSNVDQGAAYVFVQNGTTWSQQAELTASDGATDDYFGSSVAISGDTVIGGAPGHNAAYVFAPTGATWGQQAELTASDGGGGFGSSVAASGSTVVVGAPYLTVGSNYEQGAAYVFAQNGTTWNQQAEPIASDGEAYDCFGLSVAVSGGTAVVGAPYRSFGSDYESVGVAYVFVQNGTTWNQQQELTASDFERYAMFGFGVAISGSTAVVGAPGQGFPSLMAGAAYLFVQGDGTWTQESELNPSDGKCCDLFGWSVSVSGNTALAGAPHHKVGRNNLQGAAYVFGPGVITVTLSRTSLSFGHEALNNTSGARRATLTNTSTGTLSITSITTSGDFAISASTCGATLTAGKSCSVRVTFTPTELGALAGTLSFNDNATGSPQTVALSGTGVAQATLTPASYTFKETKVGDTSAAHNFTLRNNLPTTLTGISYSTAAPFAVSASTCGTMLNSEETCTISVTFSPTASGPATGTLTVSDSADSSPQTASLSGTGD